MGCETTTDIDAIARRRRRLRPAHAAASACRRARTTCRACASTPRAGASRPSGCGPGQKVMHPGPMNRGVEIDPRVADAADALIETQVRAGLVVRMAVLYDLLTTGPGRRSRRAVRGGGGVMLCVRGRAAGRTSSSAARACSIRPRASTRARRARSTTASIAELGSSADANGHRVIDGAGSCSRRPSSTRTSTCARPAARTRRRSPRGTAAAAAGGYCAILAMPNTEPVVDSAAVLGALVEQARARGGGAGRLPRRDHEGPAGRRADRDGRARRRRRGRLLRRRHAGRVAPALMRRALQYASITGRPLALHCEEPTLSRGGHMHEGTVSAELGFGGWPSVAESVMVERDLSLAAYESRPLHLMHLSAQESVDALRRAQADGSRARRRGDAAPPRADRRSRALARPEREDEPAARHRRGPQGADRGGSATGRSRAIATDHAPHARHEKEVPFEAAPFGVTGLETRSRRSTRTSSSPGSLSLETLLERMSAGPARVYGLERPRIAVGRAREPRPARPRRRAGRSPRTASAPARRTPGCSARSCAAGFARRSPPGRLVHES